MTKVFARHSTLVAQGKKMTAGEIAAVYGCTRSAIYKLSVAQDFGFVSAVPRKLPDAKALRALVKKKPNTTAADLIEQFGVSPSTVSVRCKAAGIKLKRKPYARRKVRS